MAVTSETIKELREMTSCGVMECKKALEESGGDIDKAKQILQKRGMEIAAKKGGREAKEGRVEAYIHAGSKIGVMLELNCETDFVAKSEEFIRLSKDVAMHIAAMSPKYISQNDVPADEISAGTSKEDYCKSVCLIEQPFVKDPKLTIKDCITNLIGKIGENVQVSRFVRYKVGE